FGTKIAQTSEHTTTLSGESRVSLPGRLHLRLDICAGICTLSQSYVRDVILKVVDRRIRTNWSGIHGPSRRHLECALLERTIGEVNREVSSLRLPNNFVSHAPSQVDDFIIDLPVLTNVHREFGRACL